MPLARDVVRELAVTHGGCVRPVQLRRTDIQTGQVEQVLVPCGHTLAAVCPSCAERAKALRAAQCREGWHLDHEPVDQADDPDDEQRMWVEMRAEAQAERDHAQAAGQDTGELDALNGELDEEITRSGVRGKVMPTRPARRHRSTRRRQDTPDLPRRNVSARHDRQDLHRPGRHDVPPVDVPHPDLPLLWPRPRRRHPGRPGRLRLPAGRARRAALRRAVRPVHPEPAPLPRIRRPVLRRHRTPAPPRPARAYRDPRHHLPRRAAPGPRRDLPPGLVATRHRGQVPRRRAAGLARGQRQLPRPRHRGTPAHLGPGPRRDRRPRRAAARGPVRRPSSTPKASWPDHATPTGASAT